MQRYVPVSQSHLRGRSDNGWLRARPHKEKLVKKLERNVSNTTNSNSSSSRSMSLLSVTCSQTVHFSNPPENFPTNKKFSLPTAPISVPTLKFSSRYRFRAKSTEQEADAQSSGENVTVATNGGGSSTSFLSLLCPLLNLFSGGDPSHERNYNLEVATSSLSTLARLPWGSKLLSHNSHSQVISTVDPPMLLQLFEFEACPFCRRVREALTELDLSVEVYPCPKGSVRHREMVRRYGGKEQFPFLVDPNTGISMYESGEIVKYLFQQYGKGSSPSNGLLESTLFTGWVPTILRAGRGMTLWEKARLEPPPKKLELFSYENNPYARIVREALCELELPYVLQNVGEGSLRTKLLFEASASKEVPYMIDPNTGTQIGDYKKILSYLFLTYSAAAV